MRDPHRLEQEEAHRRLDEDDHQRGDFRGAQRAREVVAGADHLRHRQRDQLEVDERAARGDSHDEEGDGELRERRHGERVLRLVGRGVDLLVIRPARIDGAGARLQARQVLLDLREVLVHRAPEGHEALQDLVPRFIGLAVFGDRLVVDGGDRALDLLEHAQHELVAGRLHVGDGGHGVGPVGRRRRHLAAFLVVLLDLGDLVEELPLQRRIALQVARHQRAQALELALDALADLPASVGEQHRLVPLVDLVRRRGERARRHAQRPADHVAERADQIVHRPARGVHERHADHDQHQHGQRHVVRPQQPGLKAHDVPSLSDRTLDQNALRRLTTYCDSGTMTSRHRAISPARWRIPTHPRRCIAAALCRAIAGTFGDTMAEQLLREPLRLPLAFFASGAAALLFQVLWFRALARVLGNTVWAGTLVLTAFMLGMAIGGLLAARWAQRIRNPVRAFALAETTVALTGSLLVWSLPVLEPVIGHWLSSLTAHPAASAGARLALALAAMLVPTIAMGTTLALGVRALAHKETARALGALYAANTLGA